MAKLRVMVAKIAAHQDLIDELLNKDYFADGFGACDMFTEGQQFLFDEFPTKPGDFPCEWAWAEILRDISMVWNGGRTPWMKKQGALLTCCSDGFRPVSFLIERLEDGES